MKAERATDMAGNNFGKMIGAAIADTVNKKERSYEEAKEYATKIIDDMAAADLTYSDAARILRIATDEVGNRMRSEKVKASQ